MSLRVRIAIVTAVFSAASAARAGGNFVGDPGSQGTQRAGAFVARADDPTALWYNPAGLAGLRRSALHLGVALVGFAQRFTRDGVYAGAAPWSGQPYPTVAHAGGPQAVPIAVLAVPIGGVTWAAGLLAPQGYGSRSFPTVMPDGAPDPARYDTIEQRGLVALPSIGAAIRRGRLRLGARLSWGIAQIHSVSAGQGLRNAEEDPDRDVTSTIDGTDRFVPAAGLGLQLDLGGGVTLAAAWTSPLGVRTHGTTHSVAGPTVAVPPAPIADAQARCARGGTTAALAACVSFNLPQTATAALRWSSARADGRETSDLELDVRWENWREARDTVIVVDGIDPISGMPLPASVSRHGLVDVWSVRVGGSHTLRAAPIALRAGVAWDSAAAPSSWRRLDLDGSARLTLAAGIGLRLGKVAIDLGGARLISPDVHVIDQPASTPPIQPDVPVPLAEPDAQPRHPFNAGRYAGGYWIVTTGMTVSW
ncbi:MAG: hypothetical protein K8W52_47060 [Deltaproteobacteria bacterium]|nr:hypothetical protein [Deltaproteobacteria bacterium]